MDTAGKILVNILLKRITEAIISRRDPSPQQHTFKKGHWPIDTIQSVDEALQITLDHNNSHSLVASRGHFRHTWCPKFFQLRQVDKLCSGRLSSPSTYHSPFLASGLGPAFLNVSYGSKLWTGMCGLWRPSSLDTLTTLQRILQGGRSKLHNSNYVLLCENLKSGSASTSPRGRTGRSSFL